jgi:hypothetical protein
MNQKRITAVILAVMVLVGLVVCGIIGYLNDKSGRTFPNFGSPNEPLSTETPNAIDLVYCYNPEDLCVISFGQDNASNLLIVMRNNIPGLKEFYAKVHTAKSFLPSQIETLAPVPTAFPDPKLTLTPGLSPTETLEATATDTEIPSPGATKASDLYTCQKVEFASDVYYCMGNLIPDGTMVTMDVYSKSDDRLVASGEILVSTVATPAPTAGETPTLTVEPLTVEPTNTEEFTVTPAPTKIATPAPTILPSATATIPAYPYSYP